MELILELSCVPPEDCCVAGMMIERAVEASFAAPPTPSCEGYYHFHVQRAAGWRGIVVAADCIPFDRGTRRSADRSWWAARRGSAALTSRGLARQPVVGLQLGSLPAPGNSDQAGRGPELRCAWDGRALLVARRRLAEHPAWQAKPPGGAARSPRAEAGGVTRGRGSQAPSDGEALVGSPLVQLVSFPGGRSTFGNHAGCVRTR